MDEKTLSQFMADYFKPSEYVEVNAEWLQKTLRDHILQERLIKSQMLEYKRLYESLKLCHQRDTDVIYRINTRA